VRKQRHETDMETKTETKTKTAMKTKSHRKLLTCLAALLLLTALLPTAVYAWFYYRNRTPIRLEMLEIHSLVTLYRGIDGNRNGVPDMATAPTEMKYYTEPRNFEKIASDYALSEEKSADILLLFSITDFLPGENRTYKLALENNGDADNEVHMKFDTSAVTGDTELLRVISVRAAMVQKSDDGTGLPDYNSSTKIWLMDAEGGESDEVFSETLAGMVTSTQTGDPTVTARDWWLVFCLEPLSSVNAHIDELNLTRDEADRLSRLTEDEYNALAAKQVADIRFRIYFDVTNR